ncbi:MAG: hypothetical protein Ct9H300mP19_13460 [Dehalococcoidia bacterium]|nr:MAG: hypothetical protein Ct9H300mP19_13460 [Dehalococcoidia bacterium]
MGRSRDCRGFRVLAICDFEHVLVDYDLILEAPGI